MIFLLLTTAMAAPAQDLPPYGHLLRSPRAEHRLTCRGETATFVIPAGEDFFNPTSERDVIIVLGPGGEVWGSGGDDLICVYGLRSSDRFYHGATIRAGPGNDTVITYGGSNTIFGDDGDDLIFLNGDYEHAEGGDGDDHIWALGAAQAFLFGDADNDVIIGSPGADLIEGGDGTDFLLGASGVDTLDGQLGYDTCFDTAAGAAFISCEVVPPHPGLPESGGLEARHPQHDSRAWTLFAHRRLISGTQGRRITDLMLSAVGGPRSAVR